MNKRVEAILASLSDEAVSVLWAWMETTPPPMIFDQMTRHIESRGISESDAMSEYS